MTNDFLQQITTLPISVIVPNREQPRKNFREDALEELSESIEKYGLIEPIVVKKSGKYYVIIAGERRWRAARKAGLRKVPAVIRDIPEQEADEISMIENMHREDLNPVEEALAFRKYIEKYNVTQTELADILMKSRVYISNTLRLLNLPPKITELLAEGKISAGHGKAILSLPTEEKQMELVSLIMEQQLNVREAEKAARRLLKKPRKKKEKQPDVNLEYAARRLTEAIGSKVTIRNNKNSGTVTIEFYSKEELNRLYDYLIDIPE